jgi:hypothetical protein
MSCRSRNFWKRNCYQNRNYGKNCRSRNFWKRSCCRNRSYGKRNSHLNRNFWMESCCQSRNCGKVCCRTTGCWSWKV